MPKLPEEKPIITLDPTSSQPIYKQIVQSLGQSISTGKLQQGEMLPSVNSIAAKFAIARGSVLKALNELRNVGVIDSIPGKGYFITKTNLPADKNIFLLLSTFNPYREVLYNAFIRHINKHATVDVYFHHHNIKVFRTLINNHAAYYNTFVVMPEIHPETNSILKQLDQKRLYLLDAGMKDFGHKYPFVCQNYENDIYNFLENHIERLDKYRKVVLLFSTNSRAYGVITGFNNFFIQNNKPSVVIKDTLNFEFKKGYLYITMDDNDLVNLIHTSNSKKWILGQDIGVISYNETPLKSVIAEGITTITTDYMKMGTNIADMILEDRREGIENPFLVIERNSF